MTGTLRPRATFSGHTAAVYAVCHGAREGSFLSSGGDGLVVSWDLDRPDQGTVLAKVGEPVFSLFVDATRNTALIGTGSGRLLVLDLREWAETQVVELHRKGIFRIVPHTPSNFLCAGGDGILSVWRWSGSGGGPGPMTVEVQRQIPLCEEKLRDIARSTTGDEVAVACGDGTVRVLEVALFNETKRYVGHEGGSNGVAFHPRKPVLVSGGKDGFVRIWHLNGPEACLHAFAAHKGAIYAVLFDVLGRQLITAGRDALVKIWDADTLGAVQRSAREKNSHTHSVNAALWLGETLITASDDRRIHGWHLPEQDGSAPVPHIPGHGLPEAGA